MRTLELLSPARDAETAIQAILHGADAVYMGAGSHGARHAAANSLDDIRRVVEFAHPFHARVYVTVNTLMYQSEFKQVEDLIHDLYRIGVDAIIVQDMGILRLDIPPIQLHASTQCDTRTPAKARFLQDVGFSQIVMARELTLKEISEICQAVTVPVEVFVHGALCVCYSGRCQMSYAANGRSANRGECAQMCRRQFDLTDADGRQIVANKHLLSLQDFNASSDLELLIEAGASSFKIEGRLKDVAYVKNVTAYYSQLIDNIIAKHPELYRRSSYGASQVNFTPSLEKSFNRSFTSYFLDNRRPGKMASIHTSKSLGEPIKDFSVLRNGDGISYFDKKGEFKGFSINSIDRNRILAAPDNRPIPIKSLPRTLYRTSDQAFTQILSKPTAKRTLWLDITLDSKQLSATTESGNMVSIAHNLEFQTAQKPQNLEAQFARLGDTIYRLRNFENLAGNVFAPASSLAAARRALIAALEKCQEATYPFQYRAKEDRQASYPYATIDYRDNVANSLSADFYREHGVARMEEALETQSPKSIKAGTKVMTCRYCILRELGHCLRNGCPPFKLPLTLSSGPDSYRLSFDCENCEMSVHTS